MPNSKKNGLGRILDDVSKAHTFGQVARIDKSPQVQSLSAEEQQVVAATISAKVISGFPGDDYIDRDSYPVPTNC